jgi:hypothetical protein
MFTDGCHAVQPLPTEAATNHRPMSFDAAVRAALASERQRGGTRWWLQSMTESLVCRTGLRSEHEARPRQ